MKVLISAFSCEPGTGSEPGTGWTWTRAAALDHDVWLITVARNAERIEAALAREPSLRLHPVYIDLPAWVWEDGRRGMRLYYLLWQRLVRRIARKLHEQERFDVAHHVTFAVDWMPAGVVGIPGLPAIWGPVGGTTGTPWSLWRWLGWRGILREALRESTTRPMRRLFGDRAARRASLIVAQNHDVARRFSNRGPLVVEPHVALDLEEMNATIERSPGGAAARATAARAVFVGRLIPLKGLRMAIAALTEPRAAGWELHVYGSGPERKPAEKLAIKSGVAERVVFHGQSERADVLAAMAAADALLLPSMHDAGGWAVGEAVTLGVPTVCLDRGGPPILVGGSGHAVSPAGRATPARLAEALTSITTRGGQTDRWSAARLPALLKEWYDSVAIATPAPEWPHTGRLL